MKKYAYSAAAVLCALVAVAFLVMCVITLLPVGLDGVRVEDPIRVSASAIDADGTKYLVQVRGSLINENDDPIALDAITLTVSDGKTSKTLTLDGTTLHTRLVHELTDSWEDTVAYDRVDAVHVTVDGETVRVENSVESVIGTDTVVTLAVTLVAVLLCIAFSKQRYYIYQEEQMRKGQ